MPPDTVDLLIKQWGNERPELSLDGLSIVVRVLMLAKSYTVQADTALAPLDLELWEYDALAALRRQGKPYALHASALAQETQLSSGAMTHRIDRLEARGAVRRRANKEDRRSVIVALTAAGRRLIDRAILARIEAANASVSELTREQKKTLAALLRTLMHTAG